MGKPKILVLDIETSPATAYVWKLFDENIGLDQLITPSKIISVGAKFIGCSKTYYKDLYDGEKNMLQMAADLLSEADAVVTYNGDKFDLPKLTGAFLLHKIKLPPPPVSIDVLKTVRKLGLQSNRLAFASPYFDLGTKGSTNFKLWRKFMDKDKDARKKMRLYNLRDVRVLEQLYKKVLPAIKSHPRVHSSIGTCVKCGSKKLQYRGYYRTKTRTYRRFSCHNNHWDHETKAVKV